VSTLFDPSAPAIIVPALVVGPLRIIRVELALDTGAGHTTIRPRFLVSAGYNPADSTRRKHFRSVTGSATAPVIDVQGISCLARVRTNMPVIAHEPPAAIIYDGLLGLDFFRGFVLTLDFLRGRITLHSRHWWQFWR
jgi:Aspartyl protease